MIKRIVSFAVLQMAVMGISSQQLAFPGAEGFGAYASGGRGGKVIHVTNLNAAGTGSLAAAASQSGSFIVFDVGGVIDITGKSITIASNVTIAGQTAPGEGITIYGGRVIASNSKNVIIRYIRMRGGKSVNSSKCTLTLDNCENLIMDHCSVSWGPWDNVHIKDANNITWSNSIISEGIEPQRFGSITDGTRNWTVHHCLWSNNKSRNPKMKCYIQYYNNVVYNYSNGVVGGHSAADNYQDLMNNYFIAGPEGSAKYFDQWTETDHMYSTGNYFDGNCDGILNGTLITDHHSATVMTNPSLKSSAPMNLESASDAYHSIVEHVGASRVRDIHDHRLIEELTSLGTKGRFIANEDDLGGIGSVADGQHIIDTDNDGMPDDWEKANGLSTDKDDANGYAFGNGYTNIENYVNSLAVKTKYLLAPQNITVKMITASIVSIKWVNADNEDATSIILEQSEDGQNFTQVKRLGKDITSTLVTNLTPDKIYYFRMKTVSGEFESLYSPVFSVNDEYMKAGGGTAAGTTTFTPHEGKLYRIINYATIPFNSGTTLAGNPKYLIFNDNGSLGTTEYFTWDDPSLLWVITAVDGGVHIMNYGNKQYISGLNTSIDGTDRIASASTPSTLTINYTGDQQPSQSGTYGEVSMFRINSPSNRDQQIRARGFADDWFWGSGTFDRADMVFTFVEIDASHVKVFLTKLNNTLETAEALAKSAQTDVTLGYPTEAFNELMTVIAEAQLFINQVDENTSQDEINMVVERVNAAVDTFKAQQIFTFEGFSTDLGYNIYSYGTMSNANAANATTDIQRRYLYAVKGGEGESDQLVYRIGLSDDEINGGKQDPMSSNPAALWTFEAEKNGNVFVRNVGTGSYLQIENTLSDSPVTIRPYYAKDDNGKHAFFLDSNSNGNRLFNVGNPDADGKGGPLGFFSVHADRTRLRWVIEATYIEVDTKPARVYGDVTGDGKVDISDVVAVINNIAGLATFKYADINSDTKIDITDIVDIINIIAGAK